MLNKFALIGLVMSIAFAPLAPACASAARATQPFNRGAASAALAAVNLSSCKKADGPTGSGHVSVTFSPNGRVSTALIDSPPFRGSNISACISGKFLGAHIAAFTGSPVKIGKSFVLI